MQISHPVQKLASLLDDYGIEMLTTDDASEINPIAADMQASTCISA